MRMVGGTRELESAWDLFGGTAHADPTIRTLIADHDPISRRVLDRVQFFDGDLLFFLAAEARIEGAPTADVWAPHISGDVTSHSVRATHINMFDIEPAAQIGRVLADELNKKFATPARGPRKG